jgi:hypothetical protein
MAIEESSCNNWRHGVEAKDILNIRNCKESHHYILGGVDFEKKILLSNSNILQ